MLNARQLVFKNLLFLQLPSSEVSQWQGDFEEFKTDKYFYHKLTQFLFSPAGAKYREQFRFKTNIQCGYSAAPIILTGKKRIGRFF